LTLHEDFVAPAEWHFFATLHGKCACDALGGTVKRLAARASLQQPYIAQIITPRQLFSWVQTNIQNTNLEFVTELEFIEEKLSFKINSAAKPIHKSLKLYAFLPIRKGILTVKKFSTSAESEECCVTVLQENMTLDDTKGFETCVQKCLVG
jgi:hypothetical protein